MIAGGNWWRANEIVIRHLTRQTATRYRCRDRAVKDIRQLLREVLAVELGCFHHIRERYPQG
jgi:hypothetical protein